MFIGAIFFYGFSVRGPWGSFWPFLIVLVVGIWLVSAISDPVGPLYWEIAWLDFLIIGFIFALLLSAATPTRIDKRRFKEFYTSRPDDLPSEPAEPVIAIGIWFWLMLLLIVIAIIVGTMA